MTRIYRLSRTPAGTAIWAVDVFAENAEEARQQVANTYGSEWLDPALVRCAEGTSLTIHAEPPQGLRGIQTTYT